MEGETMGKNIVLTPEELENVSGGGADRIRRIKKERPYYMAEASFDFTTGDDHETVFEDDQGDYLTC